MFDGISQFERSPALQRTRGTVRVGFRVREGRTMLGQLYQAGAGKVRLPRVERGCAPEAVIINTAGGLTGGDRLTIDVMVEAGATATATTQACERIYRSTGDDALVETRLDVGPGARLDWLPQETILFDRCRLRRRLDVDLHTDSRLLVVEGVVFGRKAMGETVREASFRDRWRVRRAGRLVFADGARFVGPVAQMLTRPALLGGKCAYATVLLAHPLAESYLPAMRTTLPIIGVGVSAWDGLLVARLVADSGQALRNLLMTSLDCLRDGAALPRVWNC